MAYYLILATISTILLLNQMVTCQIAEPQQYAATAIPRNPSSVRQALGYNKYDGQDVRNTDRSVAYGNNWELYDQGNEANPAQNQYYGNQQPQQPYRYYRSILNY